ncbi:MAG TPA: hypothetical protein VMX38_15460 [Verrucomicrobiae bacterium]|jgi:hypothetical protein|nr:hypothetical protein [Verrucomicrobiae bacterium]
MLLRSFSSFFSVLSRLIFAWVVLSSLAFPQVLNQDLEIEVHDLPSLMARTPHSADVFLTSLDTVLHDREVCCGKDSALEDSAAAADPKSLKDAASRLQGRHLLSDGRPIIVNATYLTPDAVNSGLLITWFQNQHAALMQWNSRVYVVHGIVYRWTANYTPDGSGQQGTVIHKFLLWDTRCSDSRREVVFNRDTDDLSKVQGFLFVEAKPQK